VLDCAHSLDTAGLGVIVMGDGLVAAMLPSVKLTVTPTKLFSEMVTGTV